jgi:peroxiredoxin
LRGARTEIDQLGADVLAVGRQADFQARHLDETEGYGFDLLLDPDGQLTDALEMTGFPWWKLLLPSTMWSYLRWSGKARQGRPFAGTLTLQPGVVILDPGARVVWAHRGEVVGDYPPVSEVMAALEKATA